MPASLESNAPLLTVAELKVELGRWSDQATVNFCCPILDQEFRFYRSHSPAFNVVEIVLNTYPQTPPVIPRRSIP
jgi:hypothetical protein